MNNKIILNKNYNKKFKFQNFYIKIRCSIYMKILINVIFRYFGKCNHLLKSLLY